VRPHFLSLSFKSALVACLVLSGAATGFAGNSKLSVFKLGTGSGLNLTQTPLVKQPVLVSSDGKQTGPAQLDFRYLATPEYPDLARSKGWQGTVIIKTLVSEDGEVIGTWIQESSGYQVLDHSAEKTVQESKFYPAKHEDIAYTSLVLVPIQFILSRHESAS